MRTFRCAACGAFNRTPPPPPGTAPVCGRCKGELDVSGRPQPVDGAGLEAAVSGSPVPVLVDFWAPWCGPCRAAAPIFDQLGRKRAGELVVLKVNSDEAQEAAAGLDIRAIPTFVLFSGGREVARQSGVMPLHDLERFLLSAGGG